MQRLVFDTSTLIGAVLRPRSIPSRALELAIGAGELVASQDTLDELAQVLGRASLDRFRDPGARAEFLALYRESVTLVEVTVVVADCRDPKDNKSLSLALSAGAAVIVSSDDELRVLHPYRGIAILSPAQFVALAEDA